jgi:hypothetical protein
MFDVSLVDVADFGLVGKTKGSVRPRLLQCGHVELLRGMESTTVEFAEAVRYSERLNHMIEDALNATCGKPPKWHDYARPGLVNDPGTSHSQTSDDNASNVV